jgi:hypothetical protein
MKFYIFLFGRGAVRVQIGLKAESPEEAVRMVKEDLARYRKPDPNLNLAVFARSLPNDNPQALADALATLARGDLVELGVDIQSRHFENINVIAFPDDITTAGIIRVVELDTLPGLP